MPFEVVDLFCGVGGLTCGLKQAGLNVVAGFDNDKTCEFTYVTNNKTAFHCRNIREVNGEEINACYADSIIVYRRIILRYNVYFVFDGRVCSHSFGYCAYVRYRYDA